MELEKMIGEFLSVIDFKLCTMDKDSITVEDINNKDALNQELKLPIDFKSDDDLRVFRSSKLNNDYSIEVLNTKYPKVPFSKNGITSFNLGLRKNKNSSTDDEVFSAELFYDNCLYLTFIGKDLGQNYSSYRKCGREEFIDVVYSLTDDSRKLEIFSHIKSNHTDRRIYIEDKVIDNKHVAVLAVDQNYQEVYRQEIQDNEIEDYFQSLAYKSKDIVEKANESIKTLNNNIFDMVFSYYDIATQFMDVIHNSTGSNEVVNELFEKFFNNQQNEEEIPKQLKK